MNTKSLVNQKQLLSRDLPCRAVFDAGQRKVEVIGPCLEEEAATIHEGVW